jgi:chitodextrinase
LTTTSTSALSFASRESGATAPQLVLNFTGSVADTQAPSVPGGLSATASSSTNVNLAWAASSDNTGVTGYTIYRNGAVLTTVSGTSLAYSDATVQPASTYQYSVDAFDLAGNHSAASTPVQVTTPAASTSLTFLPVADTYVNAASVTTIYGKVTTLRTDASPDVHSYLRFSVTGLAGKAIGRARLLIFANSGANPGIKALTVADNTWSEAATNYSNAPVLGSLLATSPAVVAGTWITLDVTAYITGEGSFNFGVASDNATAISLAAREAGANAPQLILDLQ